MTSKGQMWWTCFRISPTRDTSLNTAAAISGVTRKSPHPIWQASFNVTQNLMPNRAMITPQQSTIHYWDHDRRFTGFLNSTISHRCTDIGPGDLKVIQTLSCAGLPHGQFPNIQVIQITFYKPYRDNIPVCGGTRIDSAIVRSSSLKKLLPPCNDDAQEIDENRNLISRTLLQIICKVQYHPAMMEVVIPELAQ